MKTAKTIGFKKGDFVLTACGFPAIIVGEVHTCCPCLEVWGFEHETGSAYSEELIRITKEEFMENALFKRNPAAYNSIAEKAIK